MGSSPTSARPDQIKYATVKCTSNIPKVHSSAQFSSPKLLTPSQLFQMDRPISMSSFTSQHITPNAHTSPFIIQKSGRCHVTSTAQSPHHPNWSRMLHVQAKLNRLITYAQHPILSHSRGGCNKNSKQAYALAYAHAFQKQYPATLPSSQVQSSRLYTTNKSNKLGRLKVQRHDPKPLTLVFTPVSTREAKPFGLPPFFHGLQFSGWQLYSCRRCLRIGALV